MDIGIDLGTTFSVLAVNGNVKLAPGYPVPVYLEECDVTVIPTPYGEQSFPSVVLEAPEDPRRYFFGTDAMQKIDEGHAPVMFSKRKMGTRETIPTSGGSIVAKDAAREFLRYLKTCAEEALGCPVHRAVVTHPAYFDRAAVEETREAAREAGFDMSLPEQLLMEPVAAALAYTRTDKRDPLRTLTYDLGGGTFDVTYLTRRSGVIEMKAFDGDQLLGGYNFDRELVHWLRGRLNAQGRTVVFDENNAEDRSRLLRLLRLAEQCKINLSRAADENSMIDFRGRGIVADINGRDVPFNERLSRQQFRAIIQPYLDRTVECCRRALKKASADPTELDEILLVGGSTNGPWVSEAMKAAFPKANPRLFYPDLCVGAGAAIHAKMVLPPVIRGDQYKLLLEAPETAVLDTVHVAGQVTNAAGTPPEGGLFVSIRVSDRDLLGPTPLRPQGRFLFSDLPLVQDGPTRFHLLVTGSDHARLLEHSFEVAYAPDATEISAISSVLPKPLFVQTQDGLVPLVEEGMPLPARCEQVFQRQNDNPNISLSLYQDEDLIGDIRIENIPSEAGRGSHVILKVEVTEKNEIRGTAKVQTPEGCVLAETDVSIHFDIREIPSADVLSEQLRQLKRACLELLTKNMDRTKDVADGLEMIKQVERLFEQQPFDRQDIHVVLRRLRVLLQPPHDDLNPSRQDFRKTLRDCRDAVDETTATANQVLERAWEDVGDSPRDQALLGKAHKTLARVEQLRKLIDKLEDQGLAAHRRRDQRGWSRVCDALSGLHAELCRCPKPEFPTTQVSKASAELDIMRHFSRLHQQTRTLEAAQRLGDWQTELDRIHWGLESAMAEVRNLEDSLPANQARAHIQRLFARSVRPLTQAIDQLGVDVSRL